MAGLRAYTGTSARSSSAACGRQPAKVWGWADRMARMASSKASSSFTPRKRRDSRLRRAGSESASGSARSCRNAALRCATNSSRWRKNTMQKQL